MMVSVFLAACGDEENRYSSYHCNLSIDNSKHLDPTLASAMDANAPGTFCVIGYTIKAGSKYYTFGNSFGLHSESIFNAIDERLQNHEHIGMNGSLIVGYSNMDYPAVFHAYDGECPNCFDLNALPMRSYRLTIDGNGIAICANCKRQYKLNSEGVSANQSGKPLTQYRASSTGANGVLRVN